MNQSASSILYRTVLPALIFAVLFQKDIQARDLTPRDIIRKYEDQTRGQSSYGRFEIKIIRPRFTRTMKLDSWDDSDSDRAFMKILEPKKDRGIAFLKSGNNLWQYIPSIGKEIKIEGSLMQDSWMGSDFTNDDLVRNTSVVDDYDHSFLESSDPSHYKIQMVPRPHAAVIWSRVVITIRKSDLMPVQQLFYDHKDRLSRVMDFSDYRTMGGRLIPATMKVHTVKGGKKISSTEMRYISINFNIAINDYIFSRAHLRK